MAGRALLAQKPAARTCIEGNALTQWTSGRVLRQAAAWLVQLAVLCVCVCVCVCARARFLLSSRRHVVLCVPACVYTVVCGTDTARTLMPRAVLHLPVRYGGHSSQGRCYHVSSSVDLSPEEAEGRGGVECRVRVAAPPPPPPHRVIVTRTCGTGGCGATSCDEHAALRCSRYVITAQLWRLC